MIISLPENILYPEHKEVLINGLKVLVKYHFSRVHARIIEYFSRFRFNAIRFKHRNRWRDRDFRDNAVHASYPPNGQKNPSYLTLTLPSTWMTCERFSVKSLYGCQRLLRTGRFFSLRNPSCATLMPASIRTS